ncbi:MAG TPA: aldehyde dehydrogenase family protein, partial [Flavobacteriaceae bacterium]|nr:aldehyde dehydrogenase family protein [Flavobacteriaceae bacterium]
MIEAIVNSQKEFFKTGKTKNIDYRKQLLKRLRSELIKQENHITKALYDDFKKPEFESVISETAIVLQDLKRTIKKMDNWAKPKRVFPSLLNFPSSDYLYSEPYGTILVIAPWNYPYQLALAPLIGAVAAGNTVVLKPSELTPNTSALLSKIIKTIFPPEFVT